MEAPAFDGGADGVREQSEVLERLAIDIECRLTVLIEQWAGTKSTRVRNSDAAFVDPGN